MYVLLYVVKRWEFCEDNVDINIRNYCRVVSMAQCNAVLLVCSTAVSLVVGVAQFVPPNLRDLVLCGVRSTPELTQWDVIFNKGAFLFLFYCVFTSYWKKSLLKNKRKQGCSFRNVFTHWGWTAWENLEPTSCAHIALLSSFVGSLLYYILYTFFCLSYCSGSFHEIGAHKVRRSHYQRK